MLFAVRITECKFVPNNSDAIAMGKITTTFGPAVWKKTIVALTCANAVLAVNPSMETMNNGGKTQFFRELVEDFSSAIKHTLARQQVPEEILSQLKVVPTGLSSESHLVDGTLWFSNFWMECLTVIKSPEARVVMLKLNDSRFHSPESAKGIKFSVRLEEQLIIIDNTKEYVKSDVKKDIKESFELVGKIAGSGATGAMVGCLGLLSWPVGLVGIPVGLYVGLIVGAYLTAMSEKVKKD